MDLDIQQSSVSEKFQQNEVVMCDMDSKGKTKLVYDEAWQNQDKDVSAAEPGNNSTTGSVLSSNINSSNSELSVLDVDDDDDEDVNENDGDDCDDCVDDVSDYDDMYNFIYEDEDDYVDMQSRFDNVDLPPGVEASLPWLKNLASGQHGTSTASTSVSNPSEIESKRNLIESKRKASIFGVDENKSKTAPSTSSIVPEESRGNGEIEVMANFPHFKQFDTVDDFSDHHYSRMGFLGDEQPPKNWAKKIQDEWKILEKGLPDTIFVRVYESRMELLRAVMVGPSGTPYHDGLFVFDCLFPPSYPNEPPMVYYYSGGLRLNPNLYECGKVCLSLLGTWSGKATEMWSKKNSTMLQVLVSIQALILNAKPFFNEPGYEKSYVGEDGEKRSKDYNEEAFISSLKTMMYTLRKPPKHFEDLVANHFRHRARDILVACKAYREGAVVGSVVVKDGIPEVGEEGSSNTFKLKVPMQLNHQDIVVKYLKKNYGVVFNGTSL